MNVPNVIRMLAACAMLSNLAGQPVGAEDVEREGGLTGTGILGEITALGSIYVNNQRIVFADDLPVANALAPKRAGDLTPGDIVAVAVVPEAEDWRAKAIRQVHPLIGPVTDLGAEGFEVLGVPVRWSGEAPGAGTWVAVSGFWAGPVVSATAVEEIAPLDTASVQGSYGLDPASGTPMVGALRLDLAPLQHAGEGDVIRVLGRVRGGKLAVTDVHLGLFDGPMGLVLAEGYLSDIAPSGHYTVAGSGLSTYTDNLQARMPADRILVCGGNGTLGLPELLPDPALIDRLGCRPPEN